MSMEKTVYITEKEREMCYKVIGAFAELYEMEDEDILVVDVGRYGFVKLQLITNMLILIKTKRQALWKCA